jgi:hypothetical protein
MIFRISNTKLGTVLTLPALLASSLAFAQTPAADESAASLASAQAGKTREQAELQAAYENEVRVAREEQREALESIERARTDMLAAVAEQSRQAAILAKAHAEHSNEYADSHKLHEAEAEAMREELSRAGPSGFE